MTPLARAIARNSANEMVTSLGVRRGFLRKGLALPFVAASRELAETLATFDRELVVHGLPDAAASALGRFGVELEVSGEAVRSGPCLVLANHPGAYDALALMHAIGRRDLLILAADREFLRTLAGLSEHLAFVGDAPGAKACALKRSVTWLRRGGALLHFPAGRIEPDADFAGAGAPLLEAWQPGVSALVRACERSSGRLLVAGVRGVHSPRAKNLFANRWAERRGITTLSLLLQVAGRLRDVKTRVRFDAVRAGRDEAALRTALLGAIGSAGAPIPSQRHERRRPGAVQRR